MSMTETTTSRGAAAEDIAQSHLEEQGLTFVERNFRCRMGEIDIIMRDSKNVLVFVEVRLRNREDHVSGAESITRSKLQRLARTAEMYLHMHPEESEVDQECRFDVISIGSSIEWIKNAFTLEDLSR